MEGIVGNNAQTLLGKYPCGKTAGVLAMALSDPQQLTIETVETDLPRVSVTPTGSVYAIESDTLNLKLNINNTRNKRVRSVARIDSNFIFPDPLISGVNARRSASMSFIVDRPLDGLTPQDFLPTVLGFLEYLSADDGAIIARIMGGES
jgi:hypothetical protein